ncbi:hypothetical protein N7481_000690 [Penicillium waksmanii]|uniref:uncharacterized protein n=1 Tax=Penicillium waksmanii TaxID=69791 RepID=UPI002548AC2A|nr:uncharacterized protein N7481_000690 [Penicillium waksmanii]KAJ6000281.1 hypothetical protein N7481_000690 [Penicillium waksmanii]
MRLHPLTLERPPREVRDEAVPCPAQKVSEKNVVSESRRRKPPIDLSFVSYITYDNADDEEAVLAAFATGISAPHPKKHNVYQDELPPEPKNWREMLQHTYCKGWLTAAGLEVESIRVRKTYTVESQP